MKKMLIPVLLAGFSHFATAQSCDKKSCGPEGTKTEEARVITTLRTDLQAVVDKMSKSTIAFEKEVAEMEIAKGTTDDESLLFIAQAASAIRYEMLNKVDAAKLISPLREYRPSNASSKQKMVMALQKEIQLLSTQADKI